MSLRGTAGSHERQPGWPSTSCPQTPVLTSLVRALLFLLQMFSLVTLPMFFLSLFYLQTKFQLIFWPLPFVICVYIYQHLCVNISLYLYPHLYHLLPLLPRLLTSHFLFLPPLTSSHHFLSLLLPFLWHVGTEEGSLHRCSVSYNEQVTHRTLKHHPMLYSV